MQCIPKKGERLREQFSMPAGTVTIRLTDPPCLPSLDPFLAEIYEIIFYILHKKCIIIIIIILLKKSIIWWSEFNGRHSAFSFWTWPSRTLSKTLHSAAWSICGRQWRTTPPASSRSKTPLPPQRCPSAAPPAAMARSSSSQWGQHHICPSSVRLSLHRVSYQMKHRPPLRVPNIVSWRELGRGATQAEGRRRIRATAGDKGAKPQRRICTAINITKHTLLFTDRPLIWIVNINRDPNIYKILPIIFQIAP